MKNNGMKTFDEDELALFGGSEESVRGEGRLDVVRMAFEGTETWTWRELFEGFDSLKAITYSSSVGFACQMVGLFEEAEIIFGCEAVMSFSLQEIMAYQSKLLERLREAAGRAKTDLIGRVRAGSLRLFVARGALSHEKLYLLSAKDGRKRVVMGSANLSQAAFGGGQRETIACLDGERAYAWYLGVYESLKEASTDEIVQKALEIGNAEEELEALPIAGTVRVRNALVIEPVKEADEEVRFVMDVQNLSKRLAPSVPKPDKKGRLILSPDRIKLIRRQVSDGLAKEREVRSERPRLEIFPEEGLVRA